MTHRTAFSSWSDKAGMTASLQRHASQPIQCGNPRP